MNRRYAPKLAAGLLLLALALPAWAETIAVAGNQLLRDGQPFEIHGVQLDAFEAPKDWYGPGEFDNKALRQAYQHYGATELQYARQFGVNTIDFQVSQYGLDPGNSIASSAAGVGYSMDYARELAAAVQLARSQGFAVMLTVADSRFSGATDKLGLPTAGTLRANLQLVAMFKNDRGVILELMNEPFVAPGTTLFSPDPGRNAWNLYINGGEDARGNNHVGVNAMIRQMRAAGAQNLIVVEAPGQDFAPYLSADGSYPFGMIADPIANELAFGVHPYFQFPHIGTTPHEWDQAFGNFAASHAVIVTEWNENATKVGVKPKWCLPPPEGKGAPLDTPLQFLHYLRQRKVNGVTGWAFDMPRTLVGNFGAGAPTTMDGAVCGSVPGGIGVWLQDYFRNDLP